jgi:hypothetical protein
VQDYVVVESDRCTLGIEGRIRHESTLPHRQNCRLGPACAPPKTAHGYEA